MRNKKMIVLVFILLLTLGLAAGCGSSEKQAAPAPAAPAKTASSMPNEDPVPIAQDLERKLKDTSARLQEGKPGDAKLIMAEAVKTQERLIVHVTNAKTKEALAGAVKGANAALTASPADTKAAETNLATAQSVLKQAITELQSHKHQ